MAYSKDPKHHHSSSFDSQGSGVFLTSNMATIRNGAADSRRESTDIDRIGISSSSTVVGESSRTSKEIFPVFIGENTGESVRSSKDIMYPSDLEKGFQPPESLTLRQRLKHFTWAWYTTTMATGGLALLLSQTPHQFKGLTNIGEVIFGLDIILFIGITLNIIARFILYPGLLKKTLLHRRESLMFATFWLSIATIINNTQAYIAPHVGDWIVTALRVAFWTYTTCTFLVAVFLYYVLFTQKQQELMSVTPAWLLPIFPIMLVGTVASALAGYQSPIHSMPMLIAGLTCQGLGFFVALGMYGLWVGRLMSVGLPHGRPGMFIAVGPPSFTALALIGMANDAAKVFPQGFVIEGIRNKIVVIDVLRIMALLIAIFLWTFGFWFFFLTTIAVITGIPTGGGFHLSWWTFVFPNVGFTIGLINIGKALASEPILWLTSFMTIALFFTWLFVAVNQIRAVYQREILWTGKDEDYDE